MPLRERRVGEEDLVASKADADGRDITDEDIVAVLDTRLVYLEAIGAVGPEVDRP